MRMSPLLLLALSFPPGLFAGCCSVPLASSASGSLSFSSCALSSSFYSDFPFCLRLGLFVLCLLLSAAAVHSPENSPNLELPLLQANRVRRQLPDLQYVGFIFFLPRYCFVIFLGRWESGRMGRSPWQQCWKQPNLSQQRLVYDVIRRPACL